MPGIAEHPAGNSRGRIRNQYAPPRVRESQRALDDTGGMAMSASWRLFLFLVLALTASPAAKPAQAGAAGTSRADRRRLSRRIRRRPHHRRDLPRTRRVHRLPLLRHHLGPVAVGADGGRRRLPHRPGLSPDGRRPRDERRPAARTLRGRDPRGDHRAAGTAGAIGAECRAADADIVSRAQRSTKWCAADPGPRFLLLANRGPGAAVQRFALHRARDTVP